MNILYGIQGTGHGHISRAREIVPYLAQKFNVDVAISGYNTKLELDEIPISYRFKGLSFVYGSGGIMFGKSLKKLNLHQFYNDVRSFNLNKYDLVISDFEPVSAWAARRQNIPSLNMSHQASFMSEHTPRPEKINVIAENIMRHFAPCKDALGFHFEQYDEFILPPIIRSEVRELNPYKARHVTVYLPAFSPKQLTELFSQFDQMEWQVFSPYVDEDIRTGSVNIMPIDNQRFLKSLEGCVGLMTSSGFEACAEALYLKKKLFSIPIQNQYEQYCNAAALVKMGVEVMQKVNGDMDMRVERWLNSEQLPELRSYSTAEDVFKVFSSRFVV